MTSPVELRGARRQYGAVTALAGVDLRIDAGEFFVLLGPSGSGKTTCLRLIAGFESPDAGEVLLGGRPMTGVPPYRRPVNTVFQDYALFPHLNVLDNVAYGLMVRGIARQARLEAARDALAMVRLPDIGDRKPAQLSGGQRQRVALARALVTRPEVLLLDEPLGALDLKLREQMQIELKSLQHALGITFVFVTHDQGEALSMADRIAVFNHGQLIQVATPDEIYHRPNSRFVADFVGSSNLLPPAWVQARRGQAVWASLRPEAIRLVETGGSPARVTGASFLGAGTRVQVLMDDLPLQVLLPGNVAVPAPDSIVRIDWPAEQLHLMTAD